MPFGPLCTERLLIRQPRRSDAEAAYQRRRLPEVARYQNWALPYTRQQAETLMAEVATIDGPTDGTGWSATVVDAAAPGRILGDVYVGISWGGRTAEIGFTFHPDHWGRGYATEATQAMVDHLIAECGVQRIEASMHPDNFASARVVEACGLRFEGLTRSSFWVGEICSDDLLYGMTAADWQRWRGRPRQPPERVELVEIDDDNLGAVSNLVIHKSQERFVSPMSMNFRDALVPPRRDGVPLVPWFRAIEADGEIVGFVMAAAATTTRRSPRLWRFLIDRRHQGRGIGTIALERFEQWCRSEGAATVEVLLTEDPGSPAAMFRARGYSPTGATGNGGVLAAKSFP